MKIILISVAALILLVVGLLLFQAMSLDTKTPSWATNVQPPRGWQQQTDPTGSSFLYYENGDHVANISVDNPDQISGTSTQETMKSYSPKDLLEIRFKSISVQIAGDPTLNWRHFKVQELPTLSTHKGYRMAEGTFTVDENISGEGTIVPRIIKRILVYTPMDILDIVFASTDVKSFPAQDSQFEQFFDAMLDTITSSTSK